MDGALWAWLLPVLVMPSDSIFIGLTGSVPWEFVTDVVG